MAVMEPIFEIPLTPLGLVLGIAAAVSFVAFGPKISKKDKESNNND